MSADMAESSLVTRPFLSRPNAFPPKYEYETSNEALVFLTSLGLVCTVLDIKAPIGREMCAYRDQATYKREG